MEGAPRHGARGRSSTIAEGSPQYTSITLRMGYYRGDSITERLEDQQKTSKKAWGINEQVNWSMELVMVAQAEVGQTNERPMQLEALLERMKGASVENELKRSSTMKSAGW